MAACKGGAPALCNFSYAGPLAETVLLGNVAFRSGKRLEWDSAACKVTNTREADRFIRRAIAKAGRFRCYQKVNNQPLALCKGGIVRASARTR